MLGVTHLALRKWLLAAFSISNALHIYIASYSVAMLSYSNSMIQLGGIHQLSLGHFFTLLTRLFDIMTQVTEKTNDQQF